MKRLPPLAGLLQGIKALADEHRLMILGLLSQNPHTGEQLAAWLGLTPSTISHHMTHLKRAGLVRAEADGYYSVYHLEADSLEALGRQLIAPETLTEMANRVYDEAHTRLLSAAVQDRAPRTSPASRRKRKS